MRKQKEGIIKMKRLAKVILCVCLAAAIMVPTYAQEIFEPAMVLSDEAHVYDVVPGSSEWNELEPEERYEACAVSESEVQGMTTRALVETVLNYPYLINIYAYDSLSLGIEEVSEYFPGVQELLNRSDATEVLEEYLASKVDVQNAGEVDLASYDAKTLIGFISMAQGQKSAKIVYDTVQTPNNSDVDVIYDMDWSEVSNHLGIWPAINFDIAMAQSEQLEDLYPSATLYRDPAPNYNCHSYAWYSTSSSNKYWMDDPSLYISDGSYENHMAAVGCKVTYERASDGLYTHSGIIVATPGGPVTVRSKWGALGVFTHDINDCPYVGTGTSMVMRSWDLA